MRPFAWVRRRRVGEVQVSSIITALDEAIPLIRCELEWRLAAAHAAVAESTRLRDDLERTIDDVSEERRRADLRRHLLKLDEALDEITRNVSTFDDHALYDPIRILRTDLRSGLPF